MKNETHRKLWVLKQLWRSKTSIHIRGRWRWNITYQNLIRKYKVVINPKNKAKIQNQKVENKDQAISMEGEWLETRVRKLTYGVVAPRPVDHHTWTKNVSVKPYSKSDMEHTMLELKMPMLLNLETYYLSHHFQVYLMIRVTHL
jgi:hypothetical protein